MRAGSLILQGSIHWAHSVARVKAVVRVHDRRLLKKEQAENDEPASALASV